MRNEEGDGLILFISGIISLVIFMILKLTGGLDISWWWSIVAMFCPGIFWITIGLINEFID